MNNKKEQYKRLISFFSAIIILTLTTATFGYVWYNYYAGDIILPFYRKGNWLLVAIYTILTLLFFKVYGGFKIGYFKKADMIYSQSLAIVCVNAVSYLQISLIGRHFMNLMPMLMMTMLDIAIIISWTLIMTALHLRIYPPRNLIIVYGSRQAENLVSKMSNRIDKYIISASIKEEEGLEAIKERITDYDGVIICDISPDLRNDILKFCFENSIRTYISPKISDIMLRGAEEINLFDTPLLLNRNYGLTFEQRLFKRILDIALSVVGFIVALPIMLIVALAIKLYDGGPVFYKQKRLTINGKEFYVYKFRSMIIDAEKDGVARLACDDDDRITPVGAFIRKVRLDELPQIINIIKGDMSVVGPRPERPELTEQYKKDMPEFEFRLKVKAGLTGYAQVVGVYDTTPYDKLKMDLMYIQNYSLLLDLRIILMTLKTVIFPSKNNSSNQK
ncbi:MAG: sugar transferase [Clostridiales bacterium]|jgi:exopolysaccharide biosynthesis polyprenyl glycosylphosphotransferase|nr:sugar transferase [Clostridiales bacterium]